MEINTLIVGIHGFPAITMVIVKEILQIRKIIFIKKN